MDITAVQTLIGSLGFPIVACGALFWQLNKQRSAHSSEMEKITDALNNNTLVMRQLLDKLEDIKYV